MCIVADQLKTKPNTIDMLEFIFLVNIILNSRQSLHDLSHLEIKETIIIIMQNVCCNVPIVACTQPICDIQHFYHFCGL